jgi:Heterokaryon incompatibility protein (HET)
MMSQIYQQARVTLVDLGDVKEDDKDVQALIDRIADAFADFTSSGSDERDFSQCLEKYDLPPRTDPVWSSFLDVYTRPWFRRIWVIQEYALSRKIEILWGKEVIPGDHFFRIFIDFQQYGFLDLMLSSLSVARRLQAGKSLIALANMLEVRESIQTRQPKKLLQLLITSRPCEASDASDKILALLALASDADHPALSINYNLTPGRIYQNTARLLLERDKAIEVLYVAGGQGSPFPGSGGLPTWTPYWAEYSWEGHGLISDEAGMGPHSTSFSAAGQSAFELRFITDDKLAVRGAIIDEIVATAGLFLPEMEDLELGDWKIQTGLFDFESEAKNALRNISDYPTGEPVLQAYCSTLTLNRSESTSKQLLESYASFLSLRRLTNYREDTIWGILKDMAKTTLAGKSIFHEISEEPPWDDGASAALEGARLFHRLFFTAVRGRRFFLTRKGYMGMAIGPVKGNLICTINGSPYPFVLHGSSFFASTEYYQKGPCYVHGIMNGEALQMPDYKVQEIVLE